MLFIGDKATVRTLTILVCISAGLVAALLYQHVWDNSASRIDAVFEAWITSDSPGCACGVMKDGQLIYAKAFGLADLESQTPLTLDSRFDVASMAKQFTAASIVLLADAQAIDVDAEIRDYIPEFPDYGAPITIEDLIYHQSGIRDYSALAYFAGRLEDSSLDNASIVDLLARQKSLNFMPGERFLYSNSNYVLLAEAVERISGESFPDFAYANIFEPLNMSDTQFRGSSRLDSINVVTGYVVSPDGRFTPAYDSIATYGDGRLLSSINDIAIWDENLYRGSVGGEFLVERMRARGVLDSGSTSDYGYGLQFSNYRGLSIEHHGGATNGFRTQLMRFPTEHVSIAVFCNVTTASADLLSLQVADIVLEDVMLSRDQFAFAATEVQIDPMVFDQFVGRYTLPGDGGTYVMTVSREGGRYFAQRPGTPPIEIFASSDSEFFTRVAAGRFEFHRSESGAVTGVTITQPSGTKYGTPIVTYAQPTELDLRQFVGNYFSDELLVSYEVAIDEGRLVAIGPAGQLRLTARDQGQFTFPGDGVITFHGEMGEQAGGFRLSVVRAREIVFERIR